MKKFAIVLLVFLGIVVLIFVLFAQVSRTRLGVDQEGLFQVGHCYRNDDLGVTFLIEGSVQGKSFAKVIANNQSSTRPDYKIDSASSWNSDENPLKLHAVECR